MSNTAITTFDQATALTGKKAIDFFSVKENVLPLIAQVKEEALSLVPNVSTKKGRDEIGSTALKVSKSRTALTEAIDKSVADMKSKVQCANEVKKFVASELNSVREEVLKPRNEWKAEQDRIEAERVASIKGRITNIESLGQFNASDSKEDLASKIDALEAMDVSEGFEEFTADAASAISSAVKVLNDRILKIIEEEKAREQDRLLEAERQKSRIQERLNNLAQIPLGLMGKHSSEIQRKIDSLKGFDVPVDEFGERTEEAKASLANVLVQLEMMLGQAKQLETIQAQQTEATTQVSEIETKQPAANCEVKTFEVRAEWSGYSRGRTTYKVVASDPQEALELAPETGEVIESVTTRDDREVDRSSMYVESVNEAAA
ncbi:hypothetical protein [Vibrio sp. SCSIO 43136]|uniref:hypothetical protein n=1 Tax=Vibrio sp. SCSIO 43136 TaxID=2819101 RepID=UPI0020755C4C|nr:hypothetical protein [Vibrio sp. SCSIO 43136]USD64238.1 hypothetical protein J4N39_08955 [Vibrio sp. SCSIO 43136]